MATPKSSHREAFWKTVTAAIQDFTEHGFDSQERMDEWLERLRIAARAALVSEAVLVKHLQAQLSQVFQRTTRPNTLARVHPGVSAFTLQNIKPQLRAELDRRIMASANLIKLNRDASIQRTLQRFAGWASSVPAGGTDVAKRKVVQKDVKRAIAGLPFEERRVIIDQGHKLAASVHDIVATDGGAIAMVWHSHWREVNYDYRPAHKARDQKIYVLRDSWAVKDGYIKRGNVDFADEITQPAEEPFCRCYGQYVYALRELPIAMLSSKGQDTVKESKRAQAA